MAIMAAVAMTELLGKSTGKVSTDNGSKTSGEKRKSSDEDPSTPIAPDSPSITTTDSEEHILKRPKITANTVSTEASPVRDAESRNPSPVSTVIQRKPTKSPGLKLKHMNGVYSDIRQQLQTQKLKTISEVFHYHRPLVSF